MHRLATVVLITTALLPLAGLDLDEAAHLLRRTGFAPTKAEIDRLIPLDREQAVALLLDEAAAASLSVEPPDFTTEDLGDHHRRYQTEEARWQTLSEPERREQQQARRRTHRQQGSELKQWWLAQMQATPTPLVERLLLFWHNHFTTELRVVGDPLLIWAQHELLRSQVLGNFGELALAIPVDPAMHRYLDSDSNVKGRPNENFAREVMELFTVGEGNYDEDDIKEAARAFTGYRTDPVTGRPAKDEDLHDPYVKRVLGHRGNFDSDHILTVLLRREEEVALNIARKMWRCFIDPEPDERQIYQIAKAFYKSSYRMRPLLEAVFAQDAFWDRANRGTLIKSPVELTIGAARQLGVNIPPMKLLRACQALGQDPFDPPNVKGWHGHTAWISTQSMLVRYETLDELWQQRDQSADHWLHAAEAGGGAAVNAATMLAARPFPQDRLVAGDAIRDLLLSAVYQVK